MALLEDRLEVPSVVKITSLNFDTAKDAAAREQDKALSEKQVTTPSSLLDSLKKGDGSLLDDISSMFNSIMCNGLMPFELRLDNLLARLLKGLGLDLGVGLGCLANGILLDQILGRKPFSFLNFGLGGLSLSKQMLIGMLFGADAARLMQLFGSSGISSCSKNKMLGLLNGNFGYKGMGLNERLNMMTMLNSTLNDCNMKAYTNNVSNNWTINNITNAVTINNMITLDPATTKAYMDKLLATVPSMTNYDRTALLSGLGLAITDSTSNGVNNLLTASALNTSTNGILEKLTLLNNLLAVTSASSTTAGLLATGATGNITDSALAALNNTVITTATPSATLATVLSGLNNLDANWNVDSTLGTTNYSSVANNTGVVTLAKQSIISTQFSSVVDSSITPADLNTVQVISALNSVVVANEKLVALVDSQGNNLKNSSVNNTISSNTSPVVTSSTSSTSSRLGLDTSSNSVQTISNSVSESVWLHALGKTTSSLYNNASLNSIYEGNKTNISCCLQSICIAS